MKFDELCTKLNIKSPVSAQNVDELARWCESTISTDIRFEGNVKERFDLYKDLASAFLEKFQPNIQVNNLTAPVAGLNNKTSLQFLVDLGFDVYLKALKPSSMQVNSKINGITLLLLSAFRGHVHTAEALLSLGADPKEQNMKGEPILFVALALSIADAHNEQMKVKKQAMYNLLSHALGFERVVKDRNEMGDTILHAMSQQGYDQLVNKILSDAKTMELAFIPNNLMQYPIHTAILNAQYSCANLLVQFEGVGELTDAKKRNALHYAAMNANGEMVSKCLKYCSVNATDYEGRSALHYAVERNKLDVVQELLKDPKIDVNISDSHSQNPLDLVKKDNPKGEEIRLLLVEHKAEHARKLSNSI